MLKFISYFYKIFLIKVFYFFFLKFLRNRIRKIIKNKFYKNWNIKNIDLKLLNSQITNHIFLKNKFSETNIELIINSYTTVEILENKINSVYLYLLYQASVSKNKNIFKKSFETNLWFKIDDNFDEILESEKLWWWLLDKKLLKKDKNLVIKTVKNDKNFVWRYIKYFFVIILSIFFVLFSYFTSNNENKEIIKVNNIIEKNEIENIEKNSEKNKEEKKEQSNIWEPEEISNPDLNEKTEISWSWKVQNVEEVILKNEPKKEKLIENDFSNLKENYTSDALEVSENNIEINKEYPYEELPWKMFYLKLWISQLFDTVTFKNDVLKRLSEENKTLLWVIWEIFSTLCIIILSFCILPKLFNKNTLLFILILVPFIYLVNSSYNSYSFYSFFSYSVVVYFLLFYLFNKTFVYYIKDNNKVILEHYYKSYVKMYLITYSIIIILFIPALFYLFSSDFFNYINTGYLFDNNHLTNPGDITIFSKYLWIMFVTFMLSFNVIYYNFNSYIEDFFNNYKKSPLSRDLEVIIKTKQKTIFWEGLIDKRFILEWNKLFLIKFLYLKTRINKNYFYYLNNLDLSFKNVNIFQYKQISFSFPKNIFYDRIKSIWEEGGLDTSWINSIDKTSISYIREKNKFEDPIFLKEKINSKKSRSIWKIVINEFNRLDDFSDKHYLLYINLNTILQKDNLLSLNKILRDIEKNRLHISKIKLFLNAKEYKNIWFISTEKLKNNLNEVFNEIKVYWNRIKFPTFLNLYDTKWKIKKKYKKKTDETSLYLNWIFWKLDYFREINKLSLVANKRNDKDNFIYLWFKKDIKIEKAIVY